MFTWLRSRLYRPSRTDPAPAHEAPVISSAAPSPAIPTPVMEPSGPLDFYRLGQIEKAEQTLRALLQADPSDVESQLVRGLLALDRKRTTDALHILQQALKIAPQNFDLHIAFGRACSAAGRRPAAIAAFKRAGDIDPDKGEPLLQLALLELSAKHEKEALQLLTQAVQKEPALAEAQYALGNIMLGENRLDEAEKHFLHAVSARANYAEALCNLGSLLKDRGRISAAVPYLEQAVCIKPNLAPASFNLAMVHIGQRNWSEAATLLRSSIAADTQQPDAQYWLGNALIGLGDVAQARIAYASAIRLNKHYMQARWGLALAQLPVIPQTAAEQAASAGNFLQEIKKLKSWINTNHPDNGYQTVGSLQPFYLAYISENHRTSLGEYGTVCTKLMADWAKQSGVPPLTKISSSKCRVGIVSAHIHSHSVWHALIRGWIEHLDPAQFELHVLHTGQVRDAETEWALRRAAKLHFGLGSWTNWVRSISGCNFDVLIYPDIGMDDPMSARLAALRLARVQLASWGHPITTGFSTIDGFITAEALEPADAALHYTETIMPLARLGSCYQPFSTMPAKINLSDWNIGEEEHVLLCAGNPFKYAPRDDALLIDVARRCRPCKLVFFRTKVPQLSALLEQRLRKAFDAAGMQFDEYVRFIPWQSHAAFFGLLHRADVYLDTIGFSGFNTTLQALECGTPIVAWEGEFMRGRFASGILRQAGLDEWVADTHEGYTERVERLCADRILRTKVREEIATKRSGLYNDRDVVLELGNRLIAL